METYWIYLLKVSAAIIPFYLIYRLWLKKLTFFRMNRIFLLASLACSLALPFLSTGGWLSLPDSVPAVSVPSPDALPQAGAAEHTPPAQGMAPAETENGPGFLTILMFVYMAVAAVFLSILVLNLYRLYSLAIQAKEKETTGGLKIYYTRAGIANSSFFNRVFLQSGLPQEEKEQILYHESRHCRLGHSADLLFLEVLKVLFWFNPFIWLYKQALAELHEYEADAHSAGRFSRKSYAGTLIHLATKTTVPLLHQFSRPPLSERIHMLFKDRTPGIRQLSYLLFLPLFLLTASYSGGKGSPDESILPLVQENVDEIIRSYWLSHRNLGENPLLLIDDEEYPLSVLSDVDPKKIKASIIGGAERVVTEKNGENIEYSGEKTSDGIISLETKNGDFRFDEERHKVLKAAEIRKKQAIPENERIARYTFEGYDGKQYETVWLRRPGRGGASVTHSVGTPTYFYLDGKRVTEEEIESWSVETWKKRPLIGASDGPGDSYNKYLSDYGIADPPKGSIIYIGRKGLKLSQ